MPPGPQRGSFNNMEDNEHISSILDLPVDLLSKLFQLLKPRDVAICTAVCSRFKAAQADDLWRSICQRHYGHLTPVSNWLQGFADASRPSSYRRLYPVLLSHADYIGLWKGMDGGYRGRVYCFRWGPDCVELLQLLPDPTWDLSVPTKLEYRLGPAYQRYSAEVVDGDKIILREGASSSYPSGGASAAVEAVAAVAMAGASSSRLAGGLLGSSPTSGFGYELMRFMQGNVQQGRRRSRGRPGSSGGSSSSGGVRTVVDHFSRLPVPSSSSRQHPLVGLWKGLYGGHGLELSCITYDFAGPSARIVCTKATGDRNVPAGEVTWYAQAAPLEQPLPEDVAREVRMEPWYAAMAQATARFHMALHQEQLAFEQQQQQQAAAGGGAAGGGGGAGAAAAAAAVVGLQLQQQAAGAAAAAAGGGGSGGDGGAPAGAVQGQQQQQQGPEWRPGSGSGSSIVAVHPGKGRVAQTGFRQPEWLDGLLLVYEDGHVGFVWREPTAHDDSFLVEYHRVEDGDVKGVQQQQ